ncbi:MAG: hypothetical protein IJV56_07810 [Neisseriaceae bacterium]|nr:hypothetical protein [Neisseriaceae bacterium]MBQ9725225.1 hypothetical protein [Neisseriaceae bacterium]
MLYVSGCLKLFFQVAYHYFLPLWWETCPLYNKAYRLCGGLETHPTILRNRRFQAA